MIVTLESATACPKSDKQGPGHSIKRKGQEIEGMPAYLCFVFHLVRRGIICYFVFEGKTAGAIGVIAGFFNLQLAVATPSVQRCG